MNPSLDTPPQSKDAEAGLLGGLLRDNDIIDHAATIVRPDDFYHDAHQKLFTAILDTHAGGKPVDAVILFEVLKQRGQAEDVGGALYLAELLEAAPTAANAEYYAGIVRAKAVERRIIHLSHEAIRDAQAGGRPVEDLIADIESKFFNLSTDSYRDETTHVRAVVSSEMERLDSLGANGSELAGISTGLCDLDALTGGWQEGLYIIGARPSVGKSALMLTSALAAVRAGVPTLLFSLEMSRHQLVQRHLSMFSGVNLKRMRGNSRLSDSEAQALCPAADELSNAPLFINDMPGLRPSQLHSITRRMVRKHGVRLVFIDYAQLLESDESRSNAGRVEQLETISRRLKLLSRSVRVPVVALAQLNRHAAERDEKPQLHEFKGSGAFEQDADDAYLLWRIECPEEADVWTIGLDVAKQRNGPIGEIRLAYRRSCTRFENYGSGVR